MSSTSYDVPERKRRWVDFLDPARPTQHMFIINWDGSDSPLPPPHPDKVGERIEWAWQSYCRQVERAVWLKDDNIPYMNVYTGTEIFAEAFGCPVNYPEGTNPYAMPLVRNAVEASRIKVPPLESTTLMRHFEIADELRRRGGKEAMLKIVDVQSPMDIAALIWDKNDFFMAMIETPDAVRELAAKVGELLVAFLDEWFARYGREFIAHCPFYYMPCGITLSEDEIGSVSREIFVELFLPELVALSERYGGLGMHCCANARHQWENLLKIPQFKVLNLYQPKPVIEEARNFFAPHVAQMHGWCGDGDPETWPAQCPGNSRMILWPDAQSEDYAKELSDRLWAACGRG